MKTYGDWFAVCGNFNGGRGWVIIRSIGDNDAQTISREMYGGSSECGVPNEVYKNYEQANETAGWLNGKRSYRPAAEVFTKQRLATPRGPAGEFASK